MAVEPFKIQGPDSVLDDLKSRLERTPWPEELPDTDWDYGSNLGYVKELVGYWRTKFDWRGQENLINSFSHFKTHVDGLGIHFIHEKGKGPNPMPLVTTHGWPGTFFEMHKIISSSSQRRGGSWCERSLVGKLHEEFLSTTGNGNPLENSRRIGREMAARLQQAGVDSVILTST
jgi:hypothetical protein